jgi:O-antigen/teichoic acid export membrane protein
MRTARRIAGGAAWTYGAQLVTAAVQFVYAAFTSRVVSPEGFGEYGIALSVAAFITIVANGGLGRTVARLEDVSSSRVRALTLYGFVLGLLAAAVLYFSADFWAEVWNSPSAALPVRWLCISAFLSPIFGLATGLMRRLGNFAELAKITVSANVASMIIGAIGVSIYGNASSLLIAPITAQMFVLVIIFMSKWNLLVGRPSSLRASLPELMFSWNVTTSSIIAYLNGNVGKWGLAVGMGPATLGQWNRAEVVTSVPFQQLQNALVQAVYPEFRHDRGDKGRAREAWPDLLVITAWITWPAATLAAIVVPMLVPFLFGPGWEEAALMALPLALLASLQAVTVMLSSAIEALGRFRWIWSAQLMVLVCNGIGASLAIHLGDWRPVLISIFISFVLQHSFHVGKCSEAGYLNLRTLLRGYCGVLIGSLVLGAVALSSATLITNPSSSQLTLALVGVGELAVFAFILWKFRNAIPAIKLARKYGLLPGR